MSDIIQLLPDHVANQIAAGEVVQRPASVVKELLENAIDAGATHINLIIKEAGKTLIQVVDNGKGMSTTDARLSFERHATSKIKTAEDLFALSTKGFRGEALASIAAIAHVEQKTKQENQDLGTHIKIEGSEVILQEPCATPKGTTIWVKNLFFNVPARRNFLKSNAVELRHIIDEFHRVAMVHCNVHFEFYSNGNEVLNLPATNTRQRLVHIFGGKTNEKLVPVSEETELVTISGFVGKPDFAKKTRGEQFFFVNDRFVKSPYLHHAVISAFEGLLKDKSYPSYYLYLSVDPKSIDINIHPTKTEVKFDNEQSLYAILRATVKHSLGQFNIAPVLDFQRDASMDLPYEQVKKTISVPKIEVNRDFNPFATEFEKEAPRLKALKTETPKSSNTTFVSNFKAKKTDDWEALYSGLNKATETIEPATEFSKLEFESSANTVSMFDKASAEADKTQTVYQLQRKYLITTIKSGLVVVHQNRAHQRVLYEEFRKQISLSNAVSQQLLFPLELTFSSTEIALLKSLEAHLEHAGFNFNTFTEEGVSIQGIPPVITESEVSIILEQLIADMEQELPDTGFSQIDVMAKSLAKSAAVKTGVVLENEAQKHMVNQLFACEEPNRAPNGKTTFITLGVDELDKKF
ncbi:DNA mismatch repair endonuclease MutL [Aquimarina agarilytica]|uniref:DNA mismatch repair endonuclease MutL n=1 Tax=Aquimarina agarilytica TaxID=1087449 RepID=UPI000288C3A8|nr:DNA mismatch repair endonuclease MutL [Aquimarina agarilytica]